MDVAACSTHSCGVALTTALNYAKRQKSTRAMMGLPAPTARLLELNGKRGPVNNPLHWLISVSDMNGDL